MDNSLFQIDKKFLEELHLLCPEIGLLNGLSGKQDRWAQLDVDEQSIIDVLDRWKKAREDSHPKFTNNQDRALYHISQHTLQNKKNLLEFEKQFVQKSPECAENSLKLLYEQAIRANHDPDLADGLVTRFFSLSLALTKESKKQEKCDPHHLKYTLLKAKEGLHFLDVIVDSAPESQVPLVAKEAAKRAFHDYIEKLEALKDHPMNAALGEDNADALLELRDVPYSTREMLDFSIDLLEEMRMERQRITHLYCNDESITKTLRKTRAQHPYSVEEANAWLKELLTKSQSYMQDTGIFNKSLKMPQLKNTLDHSYNFVGQYHFIPPRSEKFNESYLFLNSSHDENDLKMLSVADLEVIAASFIEPGINRLHQSSFEASPIFSPHLLGFVTPLSSYSSTHIMQAWSLFSMQWMREDGFRCSFASRFMTAYMLERQAMYSIFDLEMMLGTKSVDEVTKSLQNLLLMSKERAEKVALELYCKPSMASSTLNNWLSINQLQDEARRVWRHDYNDKDFFNMIIGNGALPAQNLFQFLEDFKPIREKEESDANQSMVFAKA